ncbi:topoisomerase IV [Acidaminobacter sp. JC074]|uniref:DNA topoisomerase (ATP-hydrolyzing) subunit A n=1 Tax=Acidaminobacter sp. JC074 TaxID=2530199 RepID=UPI001F0DA4B0|nr:DNA topoisomerase (ATP-hydrolyzing) subunit A [Acidaminobacter sp. JC074]MCH4891284.1 topoisomerase IV [Acidaminobacter sp. JC074]
MNIIKSSISETLESNYMPYTMSVIVSRAIPEIDGFKPSHRKLLYTMYKMKLIKGARTKSANIVGQTMKLNPHGDQAIYATMVRLTKGNEALLHPFVDSKGNFGKITSRDMKFAASRYTEAKLAPICEDVFKDIDKNAVELVDNYDGQLKEPTLLPVAFPNILVNPNKGIAVGMASNFCSFNLREVCDATIAYMEDEQFDIHEIIKGPDFPTGGNLIYDYNTLDKIYKKGVGSFKIRSKYEYMKKDNCIEITEIPYTATVEMIIDKIIENIKNGKIKEISDVRDETDLKGLRITIDLKRGIDADKLMAKLFKLTALEDSFACNFNVLIGVQPKVLGVKGVISEWLKFRIGCIRNKTLYDIDKISDKLHLLYGLRSVLLDIDKAIKIIRETELDKEVIPNLMNAFSIDEVQAEYVADIKLRNINKEYILKRTGEIDDLEKTLEDLKKIAKSDARIKKIIAKELEVIKKKYGQDRKTSIVKADEIEVHHETSFIEDYNCKLFFTDHNYIKKITLVSLRGNDQHKLKDDDEIAQEVDATNKSDILFFSSKSNVYKMKAYELDNTKASSLGTYLPNVLDLEQDEKILYMVVTTDYSGFMIFAFNNGKLARVPLSSYETKTNRKRLVKAYSDFAPLVNLFYFKEESDLILSRYTAPDEIRLVLANTELISEKTTKNTKGIQVVRLKKGSVMNIAELSTDVELSNIEQYRIDKVPMSGTNIDIVDRLMIQTYMK